MSMRSNPAQFLITCKGCRETFGNDRKPFSLSCSPGHRLCEKCLDDYTRKFCPQCRKPISNRGSLRIDKTALDRALKAARAELSIGSSENLTSSMSVSDSFACCQRCKNPADTFKMVCPHCSQLVCQKCAAQDLNQYLPQLQLGFSRYLDLLKSVNDEVEKHVRSESQKIDKFFEERKREAKNHLVTSVSLLNLPKKREDAENLLLELDRLNQDEVFSENARGSSVEQEFQMVCNLVLRAEKVRKTQLMEPDIDFSEAVVHMDHFQEKVPNRGERFAKRAISFSLGSGLDQGEKQVFDSLFSPAPDLKMTRRMKQHSGSSGSLDPETFATRSNRSSTLTMSNNFQPIRRNTSFQSLYMASPLRPRKPSLGFNKL